jgi:hypothetical protein
MGGFYRRDTGFSSRVGESSAVHRRFVTGDRKPIYLLAVALQVDDKNAPPVGRHTAQENFRYLQWEVVPARSNIAWIMLNIYPDKKVRQAF